MDRIFREEQGGRVAGILGVGIVQTPFEGRLRMG